MKELFKSLFSTIGILLLTYLLLAFLLWDINPITWGNPIESYWVIFRMFILTWLLVYAMLSDW